MADEIVGRYKLVSSDNYDNFMKAIGVGMVKRKLANSTKPDVDVTIGADGVYSIKTISSIKTSEMKFKLDEEFVQDRIDDKKVPTTISREGNKLIEKQKDGNLEIEVIREFGDDKLKATCKAGDVVAVRCYEKYK